MAHDTSSNSGRGQSVRRLLRPLIAAALAGLCLVLVLPASAQAAAHWGPLRSRDRAAVASGTWDTTARFLTLKLSDRSRGPKCAWAVVAVGGYTVPLHVCGSTAVFPLRITEPGPVSVAACSGTRRAAATRGCRTTTLM